MFIFITMALIKRKIKEMLCQHEKWIENRACDVICTKCGKNLGFIGNYIYKGKNYTHHQEKT